MLGKSRDVVFFSVCGWAGSKSNFGKAGVAVERKNEKKNVRRCGEKPILKSKCTKYQFLKLRWGKIACRCSEKHIFKYKHCIFGPLLKFRCEKNCTAL